MSSKYDDIIDLPHPTSQNHPRMSLYDRAAQFSPFAALTGHHAAIAETGRLTDRRIELDESEITRVDAELQHLQELLPGRPTVSITYFVPDERKNGGSYQTVTGEVKRHRRGRWDDPNDGPERDTDRGCFQRRVRIVKILGSLISRLKSKCLSRVSLYDILCYIHKDRVRA